MLIYGGAALGEVSQDTADASIQLALDNGINSNGALLPAADVTAQSPWQRQQEKLP